MIGTDFFFPGEKKIIWVLEDIRMGPYVTKVNFYILNYFISQRLFESAGEVYMSN